MTRDIIKDLQQIDLLRNVIYEGMLDFKRIVHLIGFLLEAQDIPGDLVEFGTYTGNTAVLMTSLSSKKLWLYDSFEGLPEARPGEVKHAYFGTAKLKSDITKVRQKFLDNCLPEPNIVKGWFKDIPDDKLPNQIAFAHLDGDLYQSILDSLDKVYPRLVPGSRVIIDDYQCKDLPGVTEACDLFFADKAEKVKSIPAVQGYFVKV